MGSASRISPFYPAKSSELRPDRTRRTTSYNWAKLFYHV